MERGIWDDILESFFSPFTNKSPITCNPVVVHNLVLVCITSRVFHEENVLRVRYNGREKKNLESLFIPIDLYISIRLMMERKSAKDKK